MERESTSSTATEGVRTQEHGFSVDMGNFDPTHLCNASANTIGTYRYKVTKGLLDRFGEKRVIDSPITESGFCGLTVGAALNGLHPVASQLPP